MTSYPANSILVLIDVSPSGQLRSGAAELIGAASSVGHGGREGLDGRVRSPRPYRDRAGGRCLGRCRRIGEPRGGLGLELHSWP